MTDPRIDRVDPARVRVSGRLGFREATAATPRWRELVAGQGEVAVDLSALEGIDSATLAVLIAWAAHARREGSRLHYESAPAGLASLARLSGTTALLGLQAPPAA